MTIPSDFKTDNHGWAELLQKREGQPPLRGEHRVPWVVVGAGVTGLACARRLAELHANDEILLLEARVVGQGASGRNSGFAVAVSHFTGGFKKNQIEEYRRVNRINQNGLDLLQAQVDAHDIACQWRASGFHHAAADKRSLRECTGFMRYLEALEITHTPLDGAALKQRLGTDIYQRGVHVPNGVLLQPAALVRGLADSLPANVSLHENSAVLKIDKGAPLTLQLESAEVQTDRLILATNYEAGKLGVLRRYIIGSTLSGSLTRVLSADEIAGLGDLSDWGVLSLHGGGATLRLTTDHRLSIRNTAEYNGSALLSPQQLELRQALHRTNFNRRFPQLAHVNFEYAWSGVEGISRNGTNFFGRQGNNIYLAGGYNGSGISRGTTFGTCLAEYASGDASALISDCLASAPAKWLPPRPFLDIGAFATVRLRFLGVGNDQ